MGGSALVASDGWMNALVKITAHASIDPETDAAHQKATTNTWTLVGAEVDLVRQALEYFVEGCQSTADGLGEYRNTDPEAIAAGEAGQAAQRLLSSQLPATDNGPSVDSPRERAIDAVKEVIYNVLNTKGRLDEEYGYDAGAVVDAVVGCYGRVREDGTFVPFFWISGLRSQANMALDKLMPLSLRLLLGGTNAIIDVVLETYGIADKPVSDNLIKAPPKFAVGDRVQPTDSFDRCRGTITSRATRTDNVYVRWDGGGVSYQCNPIHLEKVTLRR